MGTHRRTHVTQQNTLYSISFYSRSISATTIILPIFNLLSSVKILDLVV